ncbi:MAG: hypothetical protein JXR97_06645 [Planctomycetes bacterium]|nr:hypothetical protein [Planctomycetota bacterium]
MNPMPDSDSDMSTKNQFRPYFLAGGLAAALLVYPYSKWVISGGYENFYDKIYYAIVCALFICGGGGLAGMLHLILCKGSEFKPPSLKSLIVNCILPAVLALIVFTIFAPRTTNDLYSIIIGGGGQFKENSKVLIYNLSHSYGLSGDRTVIGIIKNGSIEDQKCGLEILEDKYKSGLARFVHTDEKQFAKSRKDFLSWWNSR